MATTGAAESFEQTIPGTVTGIQTDEAGQNNNAVPENPNTVQNRDNAILPRGSPTESPAIIQQDASGPVPVTITIEGIE